MFLLSSFPFPFRPGMRLMLVSLFCLIVWSVVACAPAQPPRSWQEEGSPTNQPLTLVFWHALPLSEQPLLLTLVDRYNQTRVQVQVVPRAISAASLGRDVQAAAMAGHGPHLMLLHNHTIGDLAADNLLLPLDDLVSPTTRNQLLPAAIGGGQVQDLDGTSHLYGLPLTFDTLALYYRKDLVDTPPQDMETLLRVAHSLTEPSPTEPQPRQWGLACTLSLDKTIGYLYAYGGHIFNTEGHLVLGSEGRAGTERWLRWLQRLHQDSQILAVRDDITVESVVKAQQAAMTIDWAHALPSYHALWGDNLGVAMLPTIQKQPPRPYVQSLVLGINARSTPYEQQAALDFISYLLSNEPQKTLLEGGQQPVLLNLGINGPPPQRQAAHVFRAQAGRGQAMPNSPAMQDIIRDELERMQVTVLQGLVGPSEAVTYADTALRERLHLPSRPPLPSPTTGAGAARPLTTSGWFIMPE